MEAYDIGAARASRAITETFSSSFSSAISLLGSSIRQDIYNIYGLVRVADEIVDSHQGKDAEELLGNLETEVNATLSNGFSTNVIVHAFCKTARHYGITEALIAPFFSSMRMDLRLKTLTQEQYKTYIYGSAEVVGLFCLKVFTDGDTTRYQQLERGASALGAAYQKVNFLRDIKDDYLLRGRFYFPDTTYDAFDDAAKAAVVADIRQDFAAARQAIDHLPPSARAATKLSYDYYSRLLLKLEKMPVTELKASRASVNKWVKLRFFLKALIGQYAD